VRAGKLDVLLYRARPSYSVLDNLLNVFVLEGLVGLVTGLEVEYSAVAAGEGATASEYLSAVEPTEEYYLVGLGNIKALAVHLFGLENEGLVNACGDRVVLLDGPDALLRVIAPLKVTGSTHKSAEYLGVVTRVKNDKSHSAKNSLLNSVNYLIRYLVVSHMTPPDKNVGVFKDFLCKSAFLVVKRCRACLDVVASKHICKIAVNTAGVVLKHYGMCFFVIIFIPYCNLHIISPFEVYFSQENYNTKESKCQGKYCFWYINVQI